MATHWGKVPAGSVLPFFFDSYAGSSGASVTMSNFLVGDVEVYKGTSMTQRASDAGYALLDTDGIDFDGLTGIHGFSIDTGDNTDTGFYTVGAWFTVVVSLVGFGGMLKWKWEVVPVVLGGAVLGLVYKVVF